MKKILPNTEISSLKTLYVKHLIDGHLEVLPPQEHGCQGECTRAGLVQCTYAIKTNNLITSPPLYSPISDSPLGTSIYNAFTYPPQDGLSCAQTATQQRQSENEKREQPFVEPQRCLTHPNETLDANYYCMVCTMEAQEPAAKGLKYDSEKPPLAYIPKAALWAEGEAFAYGAKKYEPFNYKNGLAVTRSLSASIRHILQFLDGEDYDSESGVNHLGCARANLAMALDTLANHPHLDDRFNKGKK